MDGLQRRVNGFLTSAMPTVEESTRMAADLLRDEQQKAEFRRALRASPAHLCSHHSQTNGGLHAATSREFLRSLALDPPSSICASLSGPLPFALAPAPGLHLRSHPFISPSHSWHKGFALVRQGALVAVDPSKRETVWQRRLREAAKHTAGKPAFTLDAANEAAQAH